MSLITWDDDIVLTWDLLHNVSIVNSSVSKKYFWPVTSSFRPSTKKAIFLITFDPEKSLKFCLWEQVNTIKGQLLKKQ